MKQFFTSTKNAEITWDSRPLNPGLWRQSSRSVWSTKWVEQPGLCWETLPEKKKDTNNSRAVGGKAEPHTLLGDKESGTIIWEKSGNSKKKKTTHTNKSTCYFMYILREMQAHMHTKSHSTTHRNAIHNSKREKTTQMSTNWWINNSGVHTVI